MRQFEKPRNAIIYCRVSSKEQTEGYSLQNQKEACHRYAFEHGLTVKRAFVNEEGESAKTMKRLALQEMLKYVTKHHAEISAVIVWKFDRLARDHADYTYLLKHFGQMRIEVLSVTEPADDTSSGKLMKNIHGAFAEYENLVRAERTESGMKKAVEQGRWVWRPPLGYRMSEDAHGRRILVPDDKADLVREAFQLAAKGIHTQREICQRLRAKFSGIYEQRLNAILRNPLYAGLIVKPDWLSEPVKGIHEPLVDEDLFNRVQYILDGKRPPIRPHLRNNPDFPLRQFVQCPECGLGITGSHSRGRHGKRYPYYHCGSRKCGFGSVRANQMHLHFEQLLGSVAPSEAAVALFRAAVADVWDSRHELRLKQEKGLRREINKLEGQRERARELLLKGTLSEFDYREVSDSLAAKIAALRAELSEIQVDLDDVGACVDHCVKLLRDPSAYWSGAELDNRQRFQSFVFPQGVAYFKGAFGTAETSILFNVLREKRGEKSNLATPTGVEPVFAP